MSPVSVYRARNPKKKNPLALKNQRVVFSGSGGRI
jgi:hypothetical protein